MSGRQYILEAWNDYLRTVELLGAPDIQKRELRLAFYGGCGLLMAKVLSNLTPGPDPEVADEMMLISMSKELADFMAAVHRGEA